MMKQLLCLVLSLGPFWAGAQDSDLGNWILYFGNKPFNSQWNWHHEVQYRNYDAIGDLEQLLLRTGIGYNLSENNNNLLLGYAYILSENYVSGSDSKVSINEHRIYQQFISRQRFGRVGVQHRYRFEQRLVAEEFRLRIRYFLAITVALNKTQMEDGTLYLSSYDEIFLQTEGSIFDRNRLYGALGYRINSALRFELGYMNQFFSEGGRDQINVVTFVNF